MIPFLHLQRKIGVETSWVTINANHIVAYFPAVDVNHSGVVSFHDGTDIWTTSERGEDSAWRVIEDYQTVTAIMDNFVNGDRP